MNTNELAQHLNDPTRADVAGDIDRQALTRELIDDGEALELLAVGAGVEYKVIRPYLAHGHRRQWPRPRARYTPARPLFRHLQLVQSPETVSAIRTHRVTAARQEDLDAPIAIPRV